MEPKRPKPTPYARIHAYPCMLDGGFSLEKLVKCIKERLSEARKAEDEKMVQKWNEALRNQLGGDVDLEDAEAITEACKKKSTQTFFSDKTKMAKDIDSYSGLFQLAKLQKHLASELHTNERSCEFLGTAAHDNEIQSLVLIGHGVDETEADRLKASAKEGVLDMVRYSADPYDLARRAHFSDETADRVVLAKQVIASIGEGSVNVFSDGFITPDLVLHALYNRNASLLRKEKTCTVELIVDACFSGAWVEYFQAKADVTRLTQIILYLQTACSSREVSYYQGLSSLLRIANSSDFLPVAKDIEEASVEYEQTPQVLVIKGGEVSAFNEGYITNPATGRVFVSGSHAAGLLALQDPSEEAVAHCRVWGSLSLPLDISLSWQHEDAKFQENQTQGRTGYFVITRGSDIFNVHCHYEAGRTNEVCAVTFEELKPGQGATYTYTAKKKAKFHFKETRMPATGPSWDDLKAWAKELLGASRVGNWAAITWDDSYATKDIARDHISRHMNWEREYPFFVGE